MQRDSVYYVQRGMNLLIGVNRLGTQSRVRSIYYLCLNLLNEDACQTIHMLICYLFIPGEFHLFPTSLYTMLHAYFSFI